MDPSTGPVPRVGKEHSGDRDSVMKGLRGTSRFQHPQEMSEKTPEVSELLGSLSKDGTIPRDGHQEVPLHRTTQALTFHQTAKIKA